MRQAYVVLINGHVACLKTTLAYLLGPRLNIGLVTTSALGSFVADADSPDFMKLREARYETACQLVNQYLRSETSVVVEGTFARREWRRMIYDAARQHGQRDIIAITCVASDPSTVEKRLMHRRLNRDVPDAAASSMDAYWGSVAAFEPIERDESAPIVQLSQYELDTSTFRLREIRTAADAVVSTRVIEATQRLIDSGRLGHPLFGDRNLAESVDRRPVAHRLVSLDGLGGSGKTTQAHALSRYLESKGKRVGIVDEFSSGPIGLFIARSGIHEDDPRVRVSAAGSSHTEWLLILADAVSSMRHLSATQAGVALDVAIADSHILSHLAHAAALSEDDSDQLIGMVRQAAAILTEPLRSRSIERTAVFLDVPLEIATRRLEARLSRTLSISTKQFLRRLEAEYKFALQCEKVVLVDGTRSPSEITGKIIELLQ